LHLLERFNLTHYAHTPPGTCLTGSSGGSRWPGLDQPAQLLLLDEPAAGMNQSEIEALIQRVRPNSARLWT